MQITEQQIQERARQIGERPYHPTPDNIDSMYRTERSNGISIRFELMRTAMGGFDITESVKDETVVKWISQLVNAMLLEMARQELGVGDE